MSFLGFYRNYFKELWQQTKKACNSVLKSTVKPEKRIETFWNETSLSAITLWWFPIWGSFLERPDNFTDCRFLFYLSSSLSRLLSESVVVSL